MREHPTIEEMTWQQNNQDHETNLPRPPGWEDRLKDLLAEEFWSVDTAVNTLLALRADRFSYAPPAKVQPSESDEWRIGWDQHYTWELTPLERRHWGIKQKLVDAIAIADIPSEADPNFGKILRDQLGYRQVGYVPKEGPSDRLVRPDDVIDWAYKNEIDVPEEIEAIRGRPKKAVNKGKAAAAKLKRDSTFLAALLIIERDGLEKYLHKKSGQINASALAKAVRKERQLLFGAGEAPLSEEVFRRQFGEAASAFRGSH